MVRKSYLNQINEMEVSIAIERLIIADYPAPFTPARIQLDSLPSNYYDLGSVVEDTPSLKVKRERFELNTGIPKVLQYQAVMGLEGSFEVTLHSHSWRKIQVALANYTSVSSATFLGSIGSFTSASIFSMPTTPSTPIAVGQQIVITTASVGFEDNIDTQETRVVSVTSNGLVYCINPPLVNTFTSARAYKYDYVQQPIGGSAIRNFSLLGVADFIDGSQVVHEMFKATASDDWMEEIRPNKNGQIPLNFKLFGVPKTVRGCTQLLVANRFYFPTTDNSCN